MRSLPGRLATTAACWIPALLLVAVAVNQQRLARTAAISPWSGGGFGMFSTVDAPGNRHLHAFLLNDYIRRELPIAPDLQEEVRRATTLPTTRRLHRLATRLAATESGGPTTWDEIEIQVWAVDYAPGTLIPSGRLVRKERFALGGP